MSVLLHLFLVASFTFVLAVTGISMSNKHDIVGYPVLELQFAASLLIIVVGVAVALASLL